MSDFCPLEGQHFSRGPKGGILFLLAAALGQDGSREGEEVGGIYPARWAWKDPGDLMYLTSQRPPLLSGAPIMTHSVRECAARVS